VGGCGVGGHVGRVVVLMVIDTAASSMQVEGGGGAAAAAVQCHCRCVDVVGRCWELW
jgi:hypothetical protein